MDLLTSGPRFELNATVPEPMVSVLRRFVETSSAKTSMSERRATLPPDAQWIRVFT